MIQQLVQRIIDTGVPPAVAAMFVLRGDPLDLALHMEQVWVESDPWKQPQPLPGPNWARRSLWQLGAFFDYAPTAHPAWDHFGYSYVLENTRAVQIMRRVVHAYRSGEGLGVPSIDTQRWLDTTEALLFGAANPLAAWLSTSTVRQDPEAVRRNAYWRVFGLDLAFGTEDNRPPVYDKASASNANFVVLFEELLFELWQAISNVRNISGVNASDDDRIYRLAEALSFILMSRRQNQMLTREELAAATVLGWIELTLNADTPVVVDLRAHATSASDRLRLIGERVGLAPHTRSAALFAMAADLSVLLRVIESKVVSGPELAWVLYLEQRPATAPAASPLPIGASSRRVITEWAAATGKDLKVRGKAIELRTKPPTRIEPQRPQLVASR
jgi:hypothetical protein